MLFLPLRHTNRSAFATSLSPACLTLFSTLPLFCVCLELYLISCYLTLNSAPDTVLVLTPDLSPKMHSNISLFCNLRPILRPSFSRNPPRPARAPAVPSTMACPCDTFAMTFIPSDLPYLLHFTLLVAKF